MSAVRTVVGGGRTITGTTGTTTMRTHRAIGITAVIGTEIAASATVRLALDAVIAGAAAVSDAMAPLAPSAVTQPSA